MRLRRVDEGAVVGAAPRRRVVICEGVLTGSSSTPSSREPLRSVLIRWPLWESVSATVSVWDRIDRLLLRSRTEPPAREEATLPGLPRFTGALRRDRPCRVPESGAGTSSELLGSGVSGCPSDSGTGSAVLSASFSFALPFPLGFRCDLGLAGLCFEALRGT